LGSAGKSSNQFAKGGVLAGGVAKKTGPKSKTSLTGGSAGGLSVSNSVVGVALAAAVVFAVVTTWLLLSPLVEKIDPLLLNSLVVANVLIAAGFAILIILRLLHVWSDRRHQLAGSQTHMQLVAMFALVAAAPSIIAFMFAFTILRTSLNDVFSDRIERYHDTARDLANGLVSEKAADVANVMRQIAYDIRRNEEAGLGLEATPISFRQYLFAQAELRGLLALYLMDGDGRLLVRAEIEPGVYNLPSQQSLENLHRDGAPGELFTFGANEENRFEIFRGALSLLDYGGGYLIAYQDADPVTARRLAGVAAQRSDWRDAELGRSRAENVFLGGYILLAIIILSGAIWLGLWAATRIVKPIGRLIGMAEKVSGGDLGARVEVYKNDGELGALARALNHMTAQLQTQRDDLVETNRQFDRRRRFTEAVLSGVSAGVIGVSAEGRVTIANRSAAELLGIDAGRITGARISDVLPELESLLNSVSGICQVEAAEQIEVVRNERARTLNVRIVGDQVEGERSLVITFDDITQLISAQRNAAWGDVARRIAHEIKNPLTPIQLSAERLRRKYLREVVTTPEIFDRCTETIIKHVNDIGRMVDEFSSFARMPKPVIGREDLRELAKSAIFPQRVASTDIEFSFDAPAQAVWCKVDGRLIVQALSNLLKNATESIGARNSGGSSAELIGKIAVRIEVRDAECRVHVIDNGVGLPKAERHRLTEPYMTTRAKGTGLGLAIVRKVIEEHGGSIHFDDDASLGPTGARVSIILPLEGPSAQIQTFETAAE